MLLAVVFRPSFLRGNWHREAVVLLLDHVSKGECVFPVEEEMFEVLPWALGDLRSGINHEHGATALDQLSRKCDPERTSTDYKENNFH